MLTVHELLSAQFLKYKLRCGSPNPSQEEENQTLYTVIFLNIVLEFYSKELLSLFPHALIYLLIDLFVSVGNHLEVSH